MDEGMEDEMATTLNMRERIVVSGTKVVVQLGDDDVPRRLTPEQARAIGQLFITAACEASCRHGGEDCDCGDAIDELKAAHERELTSVQEEANDEERKANNRIAELEDMLADVKAVPTLKLVRTGHVHTVIAEVDGEEVAKLEIMLTEVAK